MIVAVVYDVSATLVRDRVARVLAGRGVHVLRSVFECVIESRDYETFCQELRAALGSDYGEVRIYRLCGECQRASRRIARGANVTETLLGPVIV